MNSYLVVKHSALHLLQKWLSKPTFAFPSLNVNCRQRDSNVHCHLCRSLQSKRTVRTLPTCLELVDSIRNYIHNAQALPNTNCRVSNGKIIQGNIYVNKTLIANEEIAPLTKLQFAPKVQTGSVRVWNNSGYFQKGMFHSCSYHSHVTNRGPLLANVVNISFNNQQRTIFHENRPLPKLVYLPNCFSWLRHKMEFWMLKQWDPEFTEGSFRYGTMQAISRITQILQSRRYEDLSGLLTKNSRIMLIHEVETRWSEIQKRLIGLKPENIQLIIPRRLQFRRVLDKKICEVDLVFIALKWAEHRSRRAMVFVEAFARFRRDFGVGVIPEWTVSIFKVHRFEVIKR